MPCDKHLVGFDSSERDLIVPWYISSNDWFLPHWFHLLILGLSLVTSLINGSVRIQRIEQSDRQCGTVQHWHFCVLVRRAVLSALADLLIPPVMQCTDFKVIRQCTPVCFLRRRSEISCVDIILIAALWRNFRYRHTSFMNRFGATERRLHALLMPRCSFAATRERGSRTEGGRRKESWTETDRLRGGDVWSSLICIPAWAEEDICDPVTHYFQGSINCLCYSRGTQAFWPRAAMYYFFCTLGPKTKLWAELESSKKYRIFLYLTSLFIACSLILLPSELFWIEISCTIVGHWKTKICSKK